MAKAKEQTSNISIAVNTQEELKKTADVPALVKKADLVITNQAEYENAAVVIKEVKDRYKELEKERKEHHRPY